MKTINFAHSKGHQGNQKISRTSTEAVHHEKICFGMHLHSGHGHDRKCNLVCGFFQSLQSSENRPGKGSFGQNHPGKNKGSNCPQTRTEQDSVCLSSQGGVESSQRHHNHR
ncbi:MAG: hypothetical protein IJM72_02545 [Deltaproteobacteria bacterium]|nr:hypothetical protein [Deltaproteobacteria bacterium]